MVKNERVFCAAGPGHHAETVRANGFCINNIAVAARYLQKQYKINKVAIIDFDVHHGNGTRNLYKDQSVAYGSSHEFPLFPEQERKMKLELEIFLLQL